MVPFRPKEKGLRQCLVCSGGRGSRRCGGRCAGHPQLSFTALLLVLLGNTRKQRFCQNPCSMNSARKAAACAEVKDVSLGCCLLVSHAGVTVTSRQGCLASLGLVQSQLSHASHSQRQKSLESCLDPQLMVNTSAAGTKCREDISVCV